MGVEPKTRESILSAAKAALLDGGYARLSTRRIAEAAGVPLSQIHYHFGSKSNLVLEVLEEENRRLLQRQEMMYGQEMPLWKRWEQACDFLDDDLESGYVRVLQEMAAAGWSDCWSRWRPRLPSNWAVWGLVPRPRSASSSEPPSWAWRR